ncbi:SDR family oxidoreductase [Novosphingobium sp. RL4]|uniref:SDR family NAD(P)-dependent oxidoreductase n=1 Tax=Novosphingobium sp. RL4 TaxID=3109595 RepID=UPI002D798A49|nr:SDR family oxidoreductase [Novosphingobium sp. RL4]WRT95671.1 SDR family oxidoreductase [Novosphingobium sp. RL4]
MNNARFSGLNVVVTGGRGGIGAAIVSAFAAEGARVVSADLACEDEDGGTGKALVLERRLDVTSEASWSGLLDFVDTHLGGLDVLVNNAGFYLPDIAFEDMPLDLWQRHFAINCDGTFLGCKHAIRHMKGRGGGSVVNLGSGMSITANPNGAAYCASKAAALMTTRAAARAAGRYGIRVNAVLPGAVPTPMLMGNMHGGETESEFLARMESFSPLGLLATPEDIARAVLFLADPANRAISGIHVPVDGGNIPGA